MLEQARFPDESFDAITMNHVIEHVPYPIGLLSECRRILRPKGKLIVVTPNIESFGARFFNKAWVHWDPPRHLFLFSPISLRVCAERAGLTNQRLWTISKEARWIWPVSYQIQRKGKLSDGLQKGLSLRLKLGGMAFWAVEYGLSKLRNLGEELVLEAVKDDKS